jgi:hypothetical protein
MGWASPVEVVVIAGTDSIVGINVESGARRIIANGRPMCSSPVAGWITCFCRRNPDD